MKYIVTWVNEGTGPLLIPPLSEVTIWVTSCVLHQSVQQYFKSQHPVPSYHSFRDAITSIMSLLYRSDDPMLRAVWYYCILRSIQALHSSIAHSGYRYYATVMNRIAHDSTTKLSILDIITSLPAGRWYFLLLQQITQVAAFVIHDSDSLLALPNKHRVALTQSQSLSCLARELLGPGLLFNAYLGAYGCRVLGARIPISGIGFHELVNTVFVPDSPKTVEFAQKLSFMLQNEVRNLIS